MRRYTDSTSTAVLARRQAWMGSRNKISKEVHFMLSCADKRNGLFGSEHMKFSLVNEDFTPRPLNLDYGILLCPLILSIFTFFFFFKINWVPVWPGYLFVTNVKRSPVIPVSQLWHWHKEDQSSPLPIANLPSVGKPVSSFSFFHPHTAGPCWFSDVQIHSEAAMIWL